MGLLPQIAQGTGVDIPRAGHYISAYALGVVIGAPVIAVAGARVPRKTMLIGLMGLFALAHMLTPVATSYPTLMAVRFLAGVPHGAYFGIGGLVAAGLVSRERRTSAIAAILGGLGVANVVGVPLATLVGQRLGWAAPFVGVGVLGLLTAAALTVLLPRDPAPHEASMLAELGALRRVQVWFALAIGVVGFGGMFAFYSYITPTMTQLAGLPSNAVPFVLMTYGLGMVTGMALAGRAARRGVLRGIVVSLALIAVALATFSVIASLLVPAFAMVYVLGLLPSVLVPLLQTRLMDVAHDGQGLAAALNHSTLNTANALGAWLGSLALSAGWGYRAPSLVGSGLAALGVLVAAASAVVGRRSAPAHASSP